MKKNMLLLFSIVGTCFAVACFMIDCEGADSFSPEELLKSNDYVLLGNFVSVDTIANLGTINYLGTQSYFSVIEYAFQPNVIYKGETNLQKVFLWNCEHVSFNPTYSSKFDLEKVSSYLVYGNKIVQNGEIINVMNTKTYLDELKSLLQGRKPTTTRSLLWNTRNADSTIALRIMTTDTLALLLRERNLRGQVIFGTDPSLGTFTGFQDGFLCYYDDNNRPHTIKRATYLERLNSIAIHNADKPQPNRF
jgi:hypothetical protein